MLFDQRARAAGRCAVLAVVDNDARVLLAPLGISKCGCSAIDGNVIHLGERDCSLSVAETITELISFSSNCRWPLVSH